MKLGKVGGHRQEGFFDSTRDDDVEPWGKVQRFLCSNLNSAPLMEIYARQFRKDMIFDEITQNFAHGKKLHNMNEAQWHELAKIRFEELINSKKKKNEVSKILNKDEALKKQQEEMDIQVEMRAKKE
jgi:predicted methyltransferase